MRFIDKVKAVVSRWYEAVKILAQGVRDMLRMSRAINTGKWALNILRTSHARGTMERPADPITWPVPSALMTGGLNIPLGMLKRCGFDGEGDFRALAIRILHLAPIEVVIAFGNWSDTDGTKAGLEKIWADRLEG